MESCEIRISLIGSKVKLDKTVMEKIKPFHLYTHYTEPTWQTGCWINGI